MKKAKSKVVSNQKLSVSDVVDMRLMHSVGWTTQQLAGYFNISDRHTLNILHGNRWAHIPNAMKIDGFSDNYRLTPDGRIWSYTTENYLAMNGNRVKLSRTNGSGSRQYITVNVDELVGKQFH